MSAGRLQLDAVEDGCYMTSDDLLTVVRTLVEGHIALGERVARLLHGEAGRTIEDLARLFDASVLDVSYALAYLTQAGFVFRTFTVATGEQGYQMLGWV